jgi:hypothetical protein
MFVAITTYNIFHVSICEDEIGICLRIIVTGKGNAKNLGRMLGYYGMEVKSLHPIPRLPKRIGKFDISLIMGVKWKSLLKSRFLPGQKVYRFQGSDAYGLMKKTKTLLKFLKSPILYASEGLKVLVGLYGEVVPTPVDTKIFKPVPGVERTKDVLYYCPKGKEQIYRRYWIDSYIKEHPNEIVTIIENTNIPHFDMPMIYSEHKMYIRMTTHDANPKMPYEALLCGCEVIHNNRRVTNVPRYMLMEETIPKIIKFFEEIVVKS